MLESEPFIPLSLSSSTRIKNLPLQAFHWNHNLVIIFKNPFTALQMFICVFNVFGDITKKTKQLTLKSVSLYSNFNFINYMASSYRISYDIQCPILILCRLISDGGHSLIIPIWFSSPGTFFYVCIH